MKIRQQPIHRRKKTPSFNPTNFSLLFIYSIDVCFTRLSNLTNLHLFFFPLFLAWKIKLNIAHMCKDRSINFMCFIAFFSSLLLLPYTLLYCTSNNKVYVRIFHIIALIDWKLFTWCCYVMKEFSFTIDNSKGEETLKRALKPFNDMLTYIVSISYGFTIY